MCAQNVDEIDTWLPLGETYAKVKSDSANIGIDSANVVNTT